MIISFYVFLTFYLIGCLLLCGMILIQESKSSGLGASFGGGDGGDSLFGTSTPEVLKKITAYFSLFFLLSCIILSAWTSALGRQAQERQPTYSETLVK